MEKLNVQNANTSFLLNKEKCPHCGSEEGFEAGIVLDPFCGSGTALVVAKKLRRNYLGIELSPKYIEIANKRLQGITSPLL